jgi:hypothetical protein
MTGTNRGQLHRFTVRPRHHRQPSSVTTDGQERMSGRNPGKGATRSIIMSRTRTRPTAIGKSGCHLAAPTPATTTRANQTTPPRGAGTTPEDPPRHPKLAHPNGETMPYYPNHLKTIRNCPWNRHSHAGKCTAMRRSRPVKNAVLKPCQDLQHSFDAIRPSRG